MTSVHVTAFVLLLLIDISFTQVTVDVGELGEIEGNEYEFDGYTMTEFLGVPYAEPPVGEFRFARPRPKVAWIEKLNATKFGAACPQQLVEGLDDLQISEDCLFLNIFVPPNATADNKLPVMLFIPGRGYRVYSGSEYIGLEMAVTGPIIIVTINYRFLTFGFFSTGDDTAPGNYGLWDQQLAIEWVRDNIGAFNGDGSKITIVGQGREGATGVVSQMLTPLNNNGLFQRAIVQSSTATDLSYISAEGQATRLSKILVDTLNCERRSWTDNLACLREKSWQDIVAVNYSVLGGGYFEPRIDGYFFPDSLDNLLEKNLTHQYDLLAGINSDEGAALLNGYVDINDAFETVQDVWNFAYYDTRQRYSSDDQAILVMNAIDYRYDGPLLELPDKKRALCFMFSMYGDRSYVSKTIMLLRNHQLSPNTNTFMYYFDYVDQNFTLIDDPLRDSTMAVQGEELFYLWDTIFGRQTALDAAPGSTSESLRENMIKYWTNFVRNGDPNTGSSPPTPPDWPQFKNNESYLLISNTIETGQSLLEEYTSFWLDYIPELTQNDDADTCSLVAPASDILRGAESESSEFVVINVTNGNSELGQIRGILRRADEGVGGRDIRSFRGIPYASPPVGERRFQYSEVLTDWGQGGIRNATEPSAGCPQNPTPILGAMEYNEDCLYLNIFAPVADQTDGVGFPVIVYLHSGLLTSGNGVVFDGTTLASYAESVIVTLNYRIGALGFISTGDDAAPGNYGIMDVVTALQWIQTYIGSFGGDAGSVTALGMGSGAQIAHLISLNKLNDGLMHKIIALGDSVLSPTILTSAERDPLEFAVQLASELDCPSEPTTALVTCLRTKSATEILQAPVGSGSLGIITFFPVVDGTFLKNSSDKILASGDYETIPFLTGATECDNTIITAQYLNASVPNRCPDELFAGAIIDDSVKIFYDGKDEFASLFKMFYLKSDLSPTVPNTDCKVGQQISEFLSDLWLNVPLLETGKLMARFDKEMYLYSLTFHPDNHVYQLFLPPWVETSFGDDVPHAFGWPYDRQAILQSTTGYSPIDRKVSINFMEMISTFAKTGVPSANPTDPESVWQPYDPLRYNALHLDVCPTQAPIPRAEEKDIFWFTIIAGLKETLIDDDEPTSTPTSTPASTTCTVGSFIGLDLTSEQAGRVIGALTITLGIIAGLIFFAIFMKLCLKIRRSDNKPV